jgi:malate synthase
MAAQIPNRNNPEASEAALSRVRADKRREVGDGHDGTWVAHPGLVSLAREVFEAELEGPNQLERLREDVKFGAADLLRVPEGTRTEEGLRLNLRVGVQYLEAWLRGVGCVPIYNLMEDAATAEICRAQVWQWVKWGAKLDDGCPVTAAMVNGVVDDLLAKRGQTSGEFTKASQIFRQMMTSADFSDFLTLPAYNFID